MSKYSKQEKQIRRRRKNNMDWNGYASYIS